MVLESTMICVDNSEFMRNGDFIPSRLQAQQDAVNMVCHSKTRSNPENNVGLLTLANTKVLATLTTDAGRILSKLHQVQPEGSINLLTGVRIAHLALKHRQGKNHRTRIIVFIGSPINFDEKELNKLAKKLKKEKVNVDIICFGEENGGTEVLASFINTLNGKDGTGSHLVTIPPGPHLADALISSPVIQGEDGTGAVGLGAGGFEFVDPNEDPELALALRVSMEEQRQRQEDEARRSGNAPAPEPAAASAVSGAPSSNEDAMLERALAMSRDQPSSTIVTNAAPAAPVYPDFATMTEEEQIAYAMQMSMQEAQGPSKTDAEAMEVETESATAGTVSDDYEEVMKDPEFLQSVLQTLPGVDPSSDAVQSAVDALRNQDKDKKAGQGKKPDSK
uniref:26S proteasome non-ATPase regulatory subunit 4 n=1 Tax=Scapholeberis mucronata TaxID=202097 RepID=A0A4Y7NLL2_9CRUS|nr:EOG090X08NC [Scapholeberis mucronata]SVE93703.1 EOG090X08NC [Scapholeberis mucronata]